MRHVLIIGLPGAGKSTLVEKLQSKRTDFFYFDLDRALEFKLGLKVGGLTDWILARQGQMDRVLEFDTLKELLKSHIDKNLVISLGGGALDIFMDGKRSLAELGKVDWVLVESDLEQCLDYLMSDHTRPHAQTGGREFWQAKLTQRLEYFEHLPLLYRCDLRQGGFEELIQLLR